MQLIDIASHQAGINLSRVRDAGYGLVNIKLTQGNWYTFTEGRHHADAARALGMGISTFSWIDNSASGAEQAAYAYRQMLAIGGPDGMAHQCDNEDTTRPATRDITRDYVNWWQDKLGRPIYMYTGDWWATSGGRASWNVASLTPYLMAAPNAGYLGSYPGDDSPHWDAGYWGYNTLSLMQYAVSPIAGAGGGDLSKTAIRDPAAWAALTGQGGTLMAALSDDEQRELLKGVRALVGGWPATVTADGKPDGRPVGVHVADLWRYLIDGMGAYGVGRADPAGPPNGWYVDELLKSIRDSRQATGAPSQDQVDAAMLKAMQDPAVINALGAAVASHIHVS
ncbi:MAG: hypothetical protein JWO67_5407 [Streptosporangiaceae bacterium]|nr:hypothetical protein [Streptosporangiaceae bacterium]